MGINNLKRESKSKACKDLIGLNVDTTSADLFSELYSLRGKIVHAGKRIKFKELKEKKFKEKLHLLVTSKYSCLHVIPHWYRHIS